jgi:hypothetical protein
MQILVLDSIHGGTEIGGAFRNAGHTVDIVDMYRGTTPDLIAAAPSRTWDLVVAPVHLDPDHPLLHTLHAPVISHHEAVRRLLPVRLPAPLVEITGARGKTTTAHALAHILGGTGILHTSTGTLSYPSRTVLAKRSITPASVLPAVAEAGRAGCWLIAEESLGVTGAGDLAIITSSEDYLCANGRKSALAVKVASAARATRVLVADGVPCDAENCIAVSNLARCGNDACVVAADKQEFTLHNPLFSLPPYRMPLMLAAAAAVLLNRDPSPLGSFAALPGRMAVSRAGGVVIVDNANSGTNAETTICAARYARQIAGTDDLTLVIGQAEADGAVCEGFMPDQVARTITTIDPARVIWVGRRPAPDDPAYPAIAARVDAFSPTLEAGRHAALEQTRTGAIVLAVKTWR